MRLIANGGVGPESHCAGDWGSGSRYAVIAYITSHLVTRHLPADMALPEVELEVENVDVTERLLLL